MTASELRDIEKHVQQLAGTYLKEVVSVYICTVDSVDTTASTCDCNAVSGDAVTDIPGVQLMAENNNGVVVVPSVGSTVIVALTTRNNAFVLLYSDIDSQEIVIPDGRGGYTTYLIQGGLQQFNDGSYNGILIGLEVANRLNLIENDINSLKVDLTAFLTALQALVTAGDAPLAPSALITALGALVATYPTTPLILTTENQIENPLITHGK